MKLKAFDFVTETFKSVFISQFGHLQEKTLIPVTSQFKSFRGLTSAYETLMNVPLVRQTGCQNIEQCLVFDRPSVIF